MEDFNFWDQVNIREEQAKDIAREEFFSDVCRRNVGGFVAKSKYSKQVKQLVAEVEMLRQLPVEMRKL